MRLGAKECAKKLKIVVAKYSEFKKIQCAEGKTAQEIIFGIYIRAAELGGIMRGVSSSNASEVGEWQIS